ncbi:MAG: CrcB family protein [Acidimicrobiales bacterium]|nr:CrcB family protein [Acidimicrobiales bacterium]
MSRPGDRPRLRDPVARGRIHPRVLAAVAAGGALGTPARYAVAQLVPVEAGGFPWATFWTNVSGSLALGFLFAVVVRRFPTDRYVLPFLAVGFLGAYTTFSTFVVEVDVLVRDGHAVVAVVYAAVSATVGPAVAAAGTMLARRAFGAT